MKTNLDVSSGAEPEADDLHNPAQASGFRKADKVDQYVGRRIRERRLMVGMSQSELAAKLGISYQQAHKYEHGQNRIAVGRLVVAAQAMNTDPAWFFEGYESSSTEVAMPKNRRMLLEMVRNLELIQDIRQMEAICAMARAMTVSSKD